MPCPHNEITIVQRSQRQSAVAAAAYQSGEKLFCEYDQQVKHYPEKRGIVHNEILLPANAPRSYTDRNTLWNAAEAVEKQWNSQLARRKAHETTYGEFKAVRDDLHRLWKVKSCVDTAARFNERTEEQMLQNRPQTRHKKEELSR